MDLNELLILDQILIHRPMIKKTKIKGIAPGLYFNDLDKTQFEKYIFCLLFYLKILNLKNLYSLFFIFK